MVAADHGWCFFWGAVGTVENCVLCFVFFRDLGGSWKLYIWDLRDGVSGPGGDGFVLPFFLFGRFWVFPVACSRAAAHIINYLSFKERRESSCT